VDNFFPESRLKQSRDFAFVLFYHTKKEQKVAAFFCDLGYNHEHGNNNTAKAKKSFCKATEWKINQGEGGGAATSRRVTFFGVRRYGSRIQKSGLRHLVGE
jgi:hypothetical protein